MLKNVGEASRPAPKVPERILVYSHSWLPGQFDGVAVRMMAHVKELVELGAKVTVVTPDFILPETPKPVTLNKIAGIVEHVTVATQKTPVYQKNMCMQLSVKNFISMVALIKRVKPDIAHGTQEASMQVLTAACLFCNVPLVVSMHTDVSQIAARDEGFSTLGGTLGRIHARLSIAFVNWGYRIWALEGATYFAVSGQSKKILQDAGVQKSKVVPEVWGPMVDRKLFCIDQNADEVKAAREALTFGLPDAYLMVYVGRVTAEKDVQFLVDALGRAPKRVVFGIIGAGSMCAELKKLHGKEHRIHCTGEMVSREQVALYMRAADLCVSASTMETIGFTAMEALSCGTPMLAANAQGFALHLSHGVNARLWKPHDEASFDSELAAIMATKLEGSWSRQRLRDSMEIASVEVCTQRALRAYEDVQPVSERFLRVIVGAFLLWLNWFIAFFIR